MIRSVANAALLAAMLLVAVAGGSLTLLAEVCRSLLRHGFACWDACAHRRAQRPGSPYEYGGAKLAHAGGFLVAAGGLAAGLAIAALAVERLLDGDRPSQLALAAAAVVAAPHCLRACLPCLTGTGRGRLSAPVAISLVVQCGLTAAALASDHRLAVCMDALLGLLLAGWIVVVAIGHASAAVRDMIDHPLPPSEEARLAGRLQAHGMASDELLSVRSRRAGRQLILEVVIDPHEALVDDACARIERARAALERETPGLSVTMQWAPAA